MECHVRSWNLADKQVIIRIDGNVPSSSQHIDDDFRLIKTIPLLRYVVAQKAYICLITHRGRPYMYDSSLSNALLVPWFVHHGFTTILAATFDEARYFLNAKSHNIVLLENIRFWPEEQQEDYNFAQKLASLGNFYINEAFGCMHRKDTSIYLLPQLFDKNHKSIGFLVTQELVMLDHLRMHSQKPYIAIIGGGKEADKLPLAVALTQYATTVIACPAVSNSIIFHTHASDHIWVGPDVLVFDTDAQHIRTIFVRDVQAHMRIVTIGPVTVRLICQMIRTAQTIFFNGPSGLPEYPESMQPIQEIVQTIAQSNAYSVIAGGDSIRLVHSLKVGASLSFLSTGGGATLTYICNKRLPGLHALE